VCSGASGEWAWSASKEEVLSCFVVSVNCRSANAARGRRINEKKITSLYKKVVHGRVTDGAKAKV
jgi:hypothetical protein